ncbi:MAG: bifunctional 5,10-methylenetetrahydrofolate dehydrogenase/5,10-methenyltetrahydrofolate cyclohydrolase [Candidatus Paceibacterota bacterium]
MAIILYGKLARESRISVLKKRIADLTFKPKLSIIQIGNLAESNTYVKLKKAFGESIGAEVELIKLDEKINEDEIRQKIKDLNENKSVNGIIVQLPIPKNLEQAEVLQTIAPEKDVDGLTTAYLKKLWNGETNCLLPATAKGIVSLLDFYKIPIEGKNVAIINHSPLVGKPLSLLILTRGGTPTICHIKTKNLSEITKRADIIISATGNPKMINENFVSPGQTVIDVGFGLDKDGKISGDVDFESVKSIVSAISPVPGGVGPMTVVSLFENLFDTI